MCNKNENSKITIFQQVLCACLCVRQYYAVKNDEVSDYKGTCHLIWDMSHPQMG